MPRGQIAAARRRAAGGGGDPICPLSGTWNLVFRDEFTAPTLDLTKWTHYFPWGSRHNNDESAIYDSSMVTMDGSNVVMRTHRQDTYSAYDNLTEPYAGCLFTSANKFDFTYGYVEAYASLTGVTSTWPAFWMLKTPVGAPEWPPEFDIYEGWGQGDANGNLTRITQTFIWNSSGGQAQSQITGGNFTTTWHRYGVEWAANLLKFYVDGIVQATYTNNVPSVPMYLILNTAMQHTTNLSLPDSYHKVDYVRVWQAA